MIKKTMTIELILYLIKKKIGRTTLPNKFKMSIKNIKKFLFYCSMLISKA